MKITCRPSCAVISKIMSTVTDSPIFQLRTQAQQDDRPSHSSQQHREGSVADKKKHPVQKFQRSQPEDSEFQIPRHGCQQTWVAFFELLVTCQSTLTYLLNPTLAAHQPPPKSQQAIDVQLPLGIKRELVYMMPLQAPLSCTKHKPYIAAFTKQLYQQLQLRQTH
jgi:hypothetical protein